MQKAHWEFDMVLVVVDGANLSLRSHNSLGVGWVWNYSSNDLWSIGWIKQFWYTSQVVIGRAYEYQAP